MSKNNIISIFSSPIFAIAAFLLGVFAALLFLNLNQKPIILAVFAGLIFLSAFILVILKKMKVMALLIFLGLGLFYFIFFYFVNSDSLKEGCSEAIVSSRPKQIEDELEFSVKSGSQKAVVVSEAVEPIGYKDKLNLCFDVQNIREAKGSYGNYLLSRYRTKFLVKNPEIEFISQGKGVIRFLFSFSDNIGLVLNKLYPGDSGVFAKGLILGGTEGMSKVFKEKIILSGISHLVAVSGYNVSIITIILFRLLRNLVSRRFAVVTSLTFLIIFCFMTGLSASVLRAALMGGLFILAKILGRRQAALNSLFIAALIMIILNPYALMDVGFQLSFAATLGLIISEEPFSILFLNLNSKYVYSFLTVATSTIVAQLFTLPILLISFGRISLVAPLANLLILPFVPLAMLLIFLSLVGYYIFPTLGYFISGFASLLLDYFTFIIEAFGSFRFASVNFGKISWLAVSGLYLPIAALYCWLQNKSEKIKFHLYETSD